MTKRMLIDASHAEETRVVVLEGNRLEDYDVETSTKRQLKGNIYLAKVVRVEPSLQAAFVEYGGNRHGFLAFGEIHPDYYQIPVADRQRLIELQEQEAREEEEEEERAAAAQGGTAEAPGTIEAVAEEVTELGGVTAADAEPDGAPEPAARDRGFNRTRARRSAPSRSARAGSAGAARGGAGLAHPDRRCAAGRDASARARSRR